MTPTANALFPQPFSQREKEMETHLLTQVVLTSSSANRTFFMQVTNDTWKMISYGNGVVSIYTANEASQCSPA